MAKTNSASLVSAKVARGTNIIDVDVPPALDRSVPFAPKGHPVAFLNDIFGGEGVTPSSVTLFTGVPGAGKTTLAYQAADALTSQGHVVVYNGNEEAAVQMRKTTRRLGVKHGFRVANEVIVGDLLEYVEEVCQEVAGKKAKDGSPVQVFCFIDSLQTMDDGKYSNGHTNTNTPVRVVNMLADFAKEPHGVKDPKSPKAIYPIFIVIGQVTKGGDFAGKQTIVHDIDAKMHLWIDVDPKSETCGKRIMAMGKNRFGSGGLEVVLAMTAKGLVEDTFFATA